MWLQKRLPKTNEINSEKCDNPLFETSEKQAH